MQSNDICRIDFEEVAEKRYVARTKLKTRTALKTVRELTPEQYRPLEDYCTVLELFIEKYPAQPVAYGMYIASDIAFQSCNASESRVKEAASFRPIDFSEAYPSPVNSPLDDLAKQINGSPEKNTRLIHAMLDYVREKSREYIDTFPRKLPRIAIKMDNDGKEHCYPMIIRPGSGEKKYSWADFAGYPDVLQKFQDMALLIKDIEHCKEHMPISDIFDKGVILLGPPGTGKTHLVRILADETDVPFKQVHLDAVGSKYVYESCNNMQKHFNEAAAPIRKGEYPISIMVIDECDSLIRKRLDADSDESRNVVNVFLENMDGPRAVPGVIVFMATNLEELLDEAATRAGRAGRKIRLDLPDESGCRDLCSLYSRRYNPEMQIDIDRIISILTFSHQKDAGNIGITRSLTGAEWKEVHRRAKRRKLMQHIKTGEALIDYSTDDVIFEISHYFVY